ncbi:MAG: hypothetical protein KAX49_20510, partial [Halanaerobiales bacterium]|nr:hypothetical protein [Halanaerobiales bacterium]
EKATEGTSNLSKGTIEHAIKRHLPSKVANEIPYLLEKMSIEQVNRILIQTGKNPRNYFNKNWTEDQVYEAVQIVYNLACKNGVTDDTYTSYVFGEDVTIILNNGVLKTAYGQYTYNLTDFGY